MSMKGSSFCALPGSRNTSSSTLCWYKNIEVKAKFWHLQIKRTIACQEIHSAHLNKNTFLERLFAHLLLFTAPNIHHVCFQESVRMNNKKKWLKRSSGQVLVTGSLRRFALGVNVIHHLSPGVHTQTNREEGMNLSTVLEIDSGCASHLAKLSIKHLESPVLTESDELHFHAPPIISNQKEQRTIQIRQNIGVLWKCQRKMSTKLFFLSLFLKK